MLKSSSWEVRLIQPTELSQTLMRIFAFFHTGVNGAGKTTQLQVVTGDVLPDTGKVIKSKKGMNIAFLYQEFDVEPSRTVREEFSSVFEDQLKVRSTFYWRLSSIV